MDHKKKKKKKNKYLDLARELKNLWKMKVAKIPFVLRALGTIHQGFKKD